MYTYSNKEFWNLLKQIKEISRNTSHEYQTLSSLNDLDKNYTNLLQKNCNLTKQNFSEPLNSKPIDSLNQKITREEVKESIKYLKTEKKPGLVNITNEMIKCSDRNIMKHLQTLFNNIMAFGYYLTSWNQGLNCSIYSSGKNDYPKNYIDKFFTLSRRLGNILSH